MSGDQITPEELQHVFEELCLSRSLIKLSEGTKLSQGNMETAYINNNSAELEILMPRISHRKGYNDFVKEKETCTYEVQYERGTSICQNEYAQTYPVKSESKVSQTTFDSSLTIQTDMLGELREEILKPKKTVSIATTSSYEVNLPNTVSNMSGLIDQGSNTDTFYCWVHPHRSFSRNRHTKSRSRTVSKMNVSESVKEPKRKKECGILKKTQEKSKPPSHVDEGDFVSSKTFNKDGKDELVEYSNVCNVDVYQNIASWSRSPFTPAEKESKTSTTTLEKLRNSSSNVKSMNSLCSNNPEWQQKAVEELVQNNEFDRSTKTCKNSAVSNSSCEEKICSQKNSWTSDISHGLKGDLISNLDKCFRDLDTPRPGLRLTRSDSSMTVFRSLDINRFSEEARSMTNETAANLKTWSITKDLNCYFGKDHKILQVYLENKHLKHVIKHILKQDILNSTLYILRASDRCQKTSILQSNDKISHKSSKTGKPTIYWAITKINIYPDNSRTYEVMPLTGKRPSEVPEKSDSVFVLIPPLKGVPKYK